MRSTEIHLPGTITRRTDGVWMAMLRDIPIASTGNTREEAWRNADNAMSGWFAAHRRQGTFDEIVERYGLKLVPTEVDDTPFEARYLVPA